MIRNILAAVVGLVIAWIVFTVIQAGSHFVFPPSVPLDPNNLESIKAYMASLTPAMFAVVLAGYAIGSFAAGLVIGKIAVRKDNLVPIIVGAFLMLGWIMNLVMLPHPMWVAIIGFFMFIPFTILGKNLTAGGEEPAEDEAPDDEPAGVGAEAAAETIDDESE